MRKKENSIQFSAEYIRKYLDGELSDQDMQALEKAALDDPFLADAIEGFEESRKHDVSFESGIANLKTRLSERIGQRKRKTGYLFQLSKWPVAASFLLIIGMAVFMVTYINRKPGISKTTPRPDTTTVVFNKAPQVNIERNDTIKPDEPIIASANPRKAGKASVNKKEKSLNQKDNDSSTIQNTGNSLASVPSGFFKDSTQETEKSTALAKKDVTAPLASSREDRGIEGYSKARVNSVGSPSGNYIKGVVVDDRGMPIPFAEVNIKGTNRHVFTDTAGFFKLYMKDPRLAALIFVQPAGYESASVEIIPDSSITNTIQLHPSPTESDAEISMKDKISPFVIGWDAFYHFIDSNKKINSKDSLMIGEEVISFTLYSDGRLSQFRIEESVSPAHDREILRLIPQAPALKLREKKRIRCVLHIQFK